MFKRTKRLSALIAAATIAAFAGTNTTAQTASSLDEFPILTIGDLAGADEVLSDAYIYGMLETAAFLKLEATDYEAIAHVRCIAAQSEEVRRILKIPGMDPSVEMPVAGLHVVLSCGDGTLDGEKGLTGVNHFESLIGGESYNGIRGAYLVGSRDYLLYHYGSHVNDVQKRCISDKYVSGFSDTSAFANAVDTEESGILVRALLRDALVSCKVRSQAEAPR